MKTSPLKLVILGHVDHGKSTLIGRLLHDTASLPEGKIQAIEKSCKKRGVAFEWAFLTDALQAERDQNITIGTTQIKLRTPTRDITIIDAPGHREFLQSMITGAAQADAALIVIDAKEGISEQTKRHGYLLHLLGVRQVVVVVGKMDKVGYDKNRFKKIEKDYRSYLQKIGIKPTHFIPISAREGEGLTKNSPRMKWHKGPHLLKALGKFESLPLAAHALRFPIQDVYKLADRRILVGRIESGLLKVGDTLLFSPTGAKAKVKTIESWGKKSPKKSGAGESIGITLDAPIFVQRGHIASHEKNAPKLTNLLRTRLFWLGKNPLTLGANYTLRLHMAEIPAQLKTIEQVIDTGTLAAKKNKTIEYGDVAEVVFRTQGLIAADDGTRMAIMENGVVAGGGIIDTRGFPDQRAARPVKSQHISTVDFGISAEDRARINGHLGGILWFTGLSGSGKSTIAGLVQRCLFEKGYQVYVLDGDNIRQGLNRDLGFSPQERHENLRRIGETAALFAQAGMIVITAFISPYDKDRELARAILPEHFHCIHIKASLKTCEKRDSKGLYKKARAGKIKGFTGISAPYETPANPDLTLDTEAKNLEACTESLMQYVDRHLVKPVTERKK